MAKVQLLLGVPGSGKTVRCLEAYARELRAAAGTLAAGKTYWLVPSREARQGVLERLLPQLAGVVFQPNVLTFDRFAERVLQETGHAGQAISGSARRVIVRRLIQALHAAEKLEYFRRIAATEGFLDVVVRFISELKRAEIWPDTFLTACRDRFRFTRLRDAELGAIYDRYQDILRQQDWYDTEGRFWLARTAMQNAQAGFWREASLIVVDGFSDFTRTQQEMLEQLALGAQQMLVTLPLEQPLLRPELFAKPASMHSELTSMFSRIAPVETLVFHSSDSTRLVGLRQIHQQLFANPRDVPRCAERESVELIAAKGERSEQIAVAYRIKQLLAQGVSPNEIVVGLRSAAVSGQAWAQYLSSAGIPVWCEAPPAWSRSPYLKALFSVLQLETEKDDWSFERLQGVLNSSFFHPKLADVAWSHADSPRRVTAWLRRLRLHSGRAAMLKSLQRRRERVVQDETEEARADLALACRVLGELSDVLEPVRTSHDLFGWADALARVTTRLGMIGEETRKTEDADRLQSLLRAAAQIEAKLSEAPIQRSLTEFLVLLRDLVQSDPPVMVDQPYGRVRIVGAEMLRHLRPDHLFLVQLTEDSFPGRRSEDCLYSEAERLQLRDGGLAVAHQKLRQREEMLLFYQAVTRAEKTLTLSYSQVNSQGHAVYASPYVTTIRELFDPALVPKEEGRLDPLPENERILTPTDLRLAAVARARIKDESPGWWRHLLDDEVAPGPAHNVLAAAETADRRFHTAGFTAFEGQLSNERNLADLKQIYNSDREFSATELESFAQCPFRFWMSHVLELEPLAAPEITTDHAGRGNLVHDVLAKLAEENVADSSAVSARFRELVQERMQQQVTDDKLRRALLRVERELLDRWANEFGNQQAAYYAKTTEATVTVERTLWEVPFGAARDADGVISPDRTPLRIVGREGQSVKLQGRIDRVDVARREGKTVFTLIDYKTGRDPKFSLEKLNTGQVLQLALYTMAVMKLGIAGPDAVAHWMGYWLIKESGFHPAAKSRGGWSPLDQATLTSLETTLAEIVPELVSRIRAGAFVVENSDSECTGYCSYRTVCRVNQVRPVADRLEKHRPPLIATPAGGDG